MSALRPGQPWGTEASGPADFEVSGGDRVLAGVLGRGVTDPLVRFAAAADSDLARSIGLVAGAAPTGLALPLDALTFAADAGAGVRSPDGGKGTPMAVNSIVVGVPPDRLKAWHRPAGLSVEIDGVALDAAGATSLAVMNGQYLRGLDLSPRGHPGDGVAEAQLYAVPPGARRAMRARLATGAHVPHPAITIRRARRIVVRASSPAALEVDGDAAGEVTAMEITLRPGAYRLLV
jgi:YegS C-terminal NAD kinase beta sandwich-like domain